MKIKLYQASVFYQNLDILSDLIEKAEKLGEKNVIFCENRLTLEVEKAIIKNSGGSFLSSATTFARFLSKEYIGDKKILSKQALIMAVREILFTESENLVCFKGLSAKNTAQKLYETIAQLKASNVTYNDLTLYDGENTMLKNKIKDISFIYQKYEEFLSKNNYIDENTFLSVLPQAINKSNEILNSNVYIIGFDSITKQAFEGVKACFNRAKSVTALLVSGDYDIYKNEASEDFERYAKDFIEKNKNATFEKIKVDSEFIPEAKAIVSNIFNPDCFKNTQKFKTDNIFIFEGENEEDEIEFVATLIKKHIFEGERFKDISVLLSNISKYSLTIKKVFNQYNINYYIDQKKNLSAHPICSFISDVFDTAITNFNPQSVYNLIKNYFFYDDLKDADSYENYLLKYSNFRGGAKKEIKDINYLLKNFKSKDAEFDIEKLNVERSKLLKIVGFVNKKASVKIHAKTVKDILQFIDFTEKSNILALSYRQSGQNELAEFIERSIQKTYNILSELESINGNLTLTASEFKEILYSGFTSCELSLLPQYLDAVYVGDITTSLKMPTKTSFCVGLTEDVPCFVTDTAIISDSDIDSLKNVKVEITPKIQDANERNLTALTLNICAFTQKLYLTYPVSVKGEECFKSEIFKYILQIFCHNNGDNLAFINREKLEINKDSLQFKKYFACKCSEKLPAERELILGCQNYEKGGEKYLEPYKNLYFALKQKEPSFDFSKYNKDNIPTYIACGESLFFNNNEVSPTKLESYFVCPYKNFAEKGLKVQPREELTIKPLDTGNFVHTTIEKLVLKKAYELDCEARLKLIKSECDQTATLSPFNRMEENAFGKRQKQALIEETTLICDEALKQIKASEFCSCYPEAIIGNYSDGEHKRIEPKEINIDGKLIKIIGKIDRIDENDKNIRIIDYKTGETSKSASKYYTGQKLQLQLYLKLAMGDKTPVGAYYFPAKMSFTEKGVDELFKLQGFMPKNSEAVLANDKNLSEGEESKIVPAKLKQKLRSDDMDQQTYSEFIDYSILVATQGAKELKQGFIAPSPYQNNKSCDYCNLKGACGFDDLCDYEARKEDRITEKQVADIVKSQS